MNTVKRSYVAYLVEGAYFKAAGDNLEAFTKEVFALIQASIQSVDTRPAEVWYDGSLREEQIQTAACDGNLEKLIDIFWDYAQLENSYIEARKEIK